MLAFLSTYKFALEVIAAVLLVAAAIAGVHHYLDGVEQKGYDRAVAEYTAASADIKAAAQIREKELNKQVEDARNAAVERDKIIFAQSGVISSNSAGLRDQINSIRGSLSGSTLNAAINTADTSLKLLNDCQSEYKDLAIKADKHVSDTETLIASWPKEKSPTK